MAKQILRKPVFEAMTNDQVRAAKNHLGTEDIHGKYVECTCKRGGGSFHGKVRVTEGKYELELMRIEIVREGMRQQGFVKKPKVDGPCVWNQTKTHTEPKPTPTPAKIQPRSKTPNLHLLRKQVAEDGFHPGISAAG